MLYQSNLWFIATVANQMQYIQDKVSNPIIISSFSFP